MKKRIRNSHTQDCVVMLWKPFVNQHFKCEVEECPLVLRKRSNSSIQQKKLAGAGAGENRHCVCLGESMPVPRNYLENDLEKLSGLSCLIQLDQFREKNEKADTRLKNWEKTQ